MAFPPEIITRQISIGGAYSLETGDPLKVAVTITASRNLVWDATGVRFERVAVKATSDPGAEVVIELPCTNVNGWRDPVANELISITDPNQYTHTYTAAVNYLDANGLPVGAVDKIGPFVVPQGDTVLDLDKTLPVSSSAGPNVQVPDTWGQMVADAEAAAEAAEAAVPALVPPAVDEYLGTGPAIGNAVNIALGGVRTAGVPLTLGADTAMTDNVTGVHGRHPFRVASALNRFRIHIRNYADVTDTAFPGALAFAGIWIGKHLLDANGTTGKFDGAPVQISPAFNTPADGSEYITEWIDRGDYVVEEYQELLFSYAYTCAAQNNIRQQGGGWRSTAVSEVASQVPATAMTKSQTMPLDIWVEAEISASTPIVAYGPGDSLLAGTGASLPVYDSFANRHALANGMVPTIMAIHGSNAGQWTDTSKWKWQKYAGLSKPDAVLIEIMSNDIFGGSAVSLATAQSRFQQMVANCRSFFATANIFATTILPRNGMASDREAVRTSYNDWLRTLPVGIVNVWDLAASIQGATPDSIDSRYSYSDGVHLNTAGYARNAQVIPSPMVRVSLSSTIMNVPITFPPSAVFTYEVTGLAVTVDGSASNDFDGTVTSWGWNFGDGTTATGETAAHTYAEAGTYVISLIVIDDAGLQSAATQQSVQVTESLTDLPVAGAIRRYVAGQIPSRAGTDIASWADIMGSGVPLTLTGGGLTGATPPQIATRSGKHVLYFDGATDGLAAALVQAQPMTLFIAFRVISIKAAVNNVLLGGGVNIFISGSLNKWQLNAGAGLNASALTPDTVAHVIGGVANGTVNSSITVDATRQTGNAGTGSKTALVVGQLPGSPTEMDVYEIVVYPSALSNSEVDSVISYMKTRYGI